MSSKEKFIELYRDWADLQLLEAYEKKSDYGPDAVSAMRQVLEERDMWEQVHQGHLATLIREKESEAKIAEEAWVQGRSKRVFGEVISPDVQGRYVDEMIVNTTKERLGKKGRLTLFEREGTICGQITHGDLKIEVSDASSVSFYATKTKKKVNFFKVSEWYTLHLLWKTEHGDIRLYRKQTSFKKLPEGFSWIDFDDPILDTKYQFEYYGTDVFLTDIQKLIG